MAHQREGRAGKDDAMKKRHEPPLSPMRDLERFEENLIPEPNTGCWLWMGALDVGGYGRFWNGTKTMKAHRAAWVLLRGRIPAGMFLLHACVGMRCCVNPDHLRIGTHAENMEDREKQRRAAFGSKNARHTHPESTARGEANGGGGKFKTSDVTLIRDASGRGVSRSALARAFGVTPGMVSSIVLRRSWRHV